jgi:hypothetical protein
MRSRAGFYFGLGEGFGVVSFLIYKHMDVDQCCEANVTLIG